MGATGTATLDFGAFPGVSDASVVITGQTGIVAGSLVEAWIRPVASSDHTADEHMVETLKVFACEIVAGTGFTIRGYNTSQLNESLNPITQALGRVTAFAGPGKQDSSATTYDTPNGGTGTRIYGTWTVAWAWL